MSKFAKHVLGLCSALLMSFVSGPSTGAMKYRPENFFVKCRKLKKQLGMKMPSDPLASKLKLDIKNDERGLFNELLAQDLAEHLAAVGNSAKIKIDDSVERTKNFPCPICLCDVTPSDPAYFCYNCEKGQNYYHIDCISEWVEREENAKEWNVFEHEYEKKLWSNRKPKCPTCKQAMPRYSPFVILPKQFVAAAYARKYGNLGWLAKI